MSREGDLMRKALRKHLIPALNAAGFVGRAKDFMRLRDQSQDLLSIQYGKHGGCFILEFGRRPRGPLRTAWGPIILETAVERFPGCVPQFGKAQRGGIVIYSNEL